MRIRFTGTGTSQGIPVIGCSCAVCSSSDPRDERLRAAVVLEGSGTTVAIDVGPDFRLQMLRSGVTELDGILITHEHNDHVAGLDDVRPFNFMQGRPMKVYAENRVNKILIRRFDYIFTKKGYPGRPIIELIDIEPGVSFKVGDLAVVPLRISHGISDVLGFRIGDFTYITDAKSIPTRELGMVKDCKVLVLNALRKKTHHSHFTLTEAVALSQELQAQQTYLTHISHQMGRHAEVGAQLPDNVHLAHDGLILTL